MKEHSRVALITGANRGLGLEISRQLAGRGLTVLMGARDTSKGVRAVALLNSESLDARQIALDVSSSQSILEAVSLIDGEFGRLDVLVNNAAVLTDIGVQPSETEESVLRANFDVNFFGPYMLTRSLSSLLLKGSNACVLNLATQVGTFKNLGNVDSPLKDDICPAYQASKIALNAMTVLFAKEWREAGIKVNSVCPGWVMTDMGHEDLPDYGDTVRAMTPAEAVEKLIYLTELPPDGPTGGFFSEGRSIDW